MEASLRYTVRISDDASGIKLRFLFLEMVCVVRNFTYSVDVNNIIPITFYCNHFDILRLLNRGNIQQVNESFCKI